MLLSSLCAGQSGHIPGGDDSLAVFTKFAGSNGLSCVLREAGLKLFWRRWDVRLSSVVGHSLKKSRRSHLRLHLQAV